MTTTVTWHLLDVSEDKSRATRLGTDEDGFLWKFLWRNFETDLEVSCYLRVYTAGDARIEISGSICPPEPMRAWALVEQALFCAGIRSSYIGV